MGCGDDVSGVDSAQGNTVDLEGAGDQEDTLVEGLQENDALATEATSEEDQDGTGLEGLARSPSADRLADLLHRKRISDCFYITLVSSRYSFAFACVGISQCFLCRAGSWS